MKAPAVKALSPAFSRARGRTHDRENKTARHSGRLVFAIVRPSAWAAASRRPSGLLSRALLHALHGFMVSPGEREIDQRLRWSFQISSALLRASKKSGHLPSP